MAPNSRFYHSSYINSSINSANNKIIGDPSKTFFKNNNSLAPTSWTPSYACTLQLASNPVLAPSIPPANDKLFKQFIKAYLVT